ncbi:MAG TPA: aspartate aminotransferase family protein [Bacteroidales bacterium]|nr:aspartate aminotransferase family protein [Bacteroidales bacterium]
MLTNRQLFLEHLGQTSPFPMLLEIVKAEGVYLYGADGKKYLDLISGVSVSNTGHCNPHIVSAVKAQADNYMHLMVYGEYIQSPQVRYAEMLARVLPESLNSVFFVNSGSEAVEGALKLVKRHTGRTGIVSFRNAYHGSTHGAMSVQGSEEFRSAFRPLLPDIHQIDFNDFSALDQIDKHIAGVIIEPVQAEGGVIYPDAGYLQAVREQCDKTGSLLIFDEIQTGFGRTGDLFAINKFNVIPDIILLAKALGGGMPLGAFISSSGIMSSLADNPILGHITTFGGHPVCCAAGLASLEVLVNDKLTDNCRVQSGLFRKLLQHRLIRNIRGEGLLLAVQLTDEKYVKKAVAMAPAYGLILDYFLFCSDAFRIAPPLIIKEEETKAACRQIINLLDDLDK